MATIIIIIIDFELCNIQTSRCDLFSSLFIDFRTINPNSIQMVRKYCAWFIGQYLCM